MQTGLAITLGFLLGNESAYIPGQQEGGGTIFCICFDRVAVLVKLSNKGGWAVWLILDIHTPMAIACCDKR